MVEPAAVVLLTGTVGAGKTRTACALSDREWARGARHAMIDLDQIRLLRPPPPGDPWQHEVELENLRDLARNYRRAGADRLILSGVVEDRSEISRYLAALDVESMLVCRLTVDPEAAVARLTARHAEDMQALRWHLDRTVELTAVLNRAGVADLTIDTTHRTPDDVASEVQRAAGWV